MSWSGTRGRLLALDWARARRRRSAASRRRSPRRRRSCPGSSIGNGGRPFAGDTGTLTTLGPGSGRVAARLQFALARPSLVSLEVLETGQGAASEQPVAVGAVGAQHAAAHAAGRRAYARNGAGTDTARAHLHPPVDRATRARRRQPGRRRGRSPECSASTRRSPCAARKPATPIELVVRTDAKRADVADVAERHRTGADLREQRDQRRPRGAPRAVRLGSEPRSARRRSRCRSAPTGRPASTSRS